MNAEFFQAIEDIEKEQGIPRGYMFDKINQAMLAAFRKDNPSCEDNVEVLMDEEKRSIEMVVHKTVVEQVEDPSHEINLEAAKKNQPSRQARRYRQHPRRYQEVRPDRRPGCQADHHPGHS